MGPLRGPAKFFLLTTLALALLAGFGVEPGAASDGRVAGSTWCRVSSSSPSRSPPPAAPSALSAALALADPGRRRPAGPARDRRRAGRSTSRSRAPSHSCAGLALARGGRLAALAGLLALLDLLRVNGELNPSADAGVLRPAAAGGAAVAAARSEGLFRWFSYGVAHSPPLHWSPAVASRNSDVWLFYLDRQALMPRTHVLDGLEGAFDIDRMGLAPEGSTLAVAEASPALFRQHYAAFGSPT